MLNHDVVLIKLTLPTAQRLQYLAGQYIDFLLQDNHRRSFSIANAPLDHDTLELHIRQVNDGYFTKLISNDLQERDVLKIQGPFGQFFLRQQTNRPIIMMAGGTGFAPIKGIIEHALALNITRPIHLYWGARALADLYLHTLPLAWADQYEHISYTPVLSDPKPTDHWQGHTGFVHQVILEDYADLSPYEIYASGPPQMVQAGQTSFTTQGLDLANYYSDAFEWAKD